MKTFIRVVSAILEFNGRRLEKVEDRLDETIEGVTADIDLLLEQVQEMREEVRQLKLSARR